MGDIDLFSDVFEVSTEGNAEIIDITPSVAACVSKRHLNEGSVLVFVKGSTASITTIEYEPGLKRDLPALLDRLIPPNAKYSHHETWGDDNGHAHLRASLIGPSIMVPVHSGALTLGTWQQIVLIDFDTRPREREIVVQCTGRTSPRA